ncbi:patatin-like phospholipase family protein [Nocardia wallacei]|uniref:patatin-like phospholipase family protein n=1 Tax=Nocardia wallacei TaxID=480035 RepID=UPI002458339F|nr:patatin-like phospholipase family protein [Nocardia wallacei]
MQQQISMEHRPVVRILAGVAGRSLAVMVGMTIGAVEALTARRDRTSEQPVAPPQLIIAGVSGGAIAAAVVAVGMNRRTARQIALAYPEAEVLGTRSFRSLLARRTLYPRARIRELAHTVVGDRTFADFTLTPEPGLAPHQAVSSLVIPVYSAEHGTLILPRDLPVLGLTDLPVADALVAATRIPGALPAAPGLEYVFDGGCQYRVPREIFAPHPALVLDLYGPQPYDSRGGLVFPLLHPALSAIRSRPRPFHDPTLREATIFAHRPYGTALQPPAQTSGELFDMGYDIASSWIDSRTDRQLARVTGPSFLDRTGSAPETPCGAEASSQ